MVVLSELCEGSSSSSSTQAHRYDVFLSFRGEDLKPELEYAIKSSRASVIVLSKNYATSTWCLDELVLILEQRMKSNHIVIPIFYHVEPTNVRKQQSSFGDAMAKHKQKMEVETNSTKRNQWVQKIELWNKALREVADLKGKDANGRQEVELIDEIVKDIFRRLCVSSRFPLPQLIGMENSIELVTSWLKDATSHTTDILTILDINRRCYTKYNGTIDVQKQLYNDISKPSSVQVHDVSVYTSMIENALARKKVFLVLDDIGSIDQLDALLGSKGFHPGSKILITTKDAWLTQSSLPFKTNIKPNYTEHKLRGLSTIEARKLLCFHAFMCNNPKAGYEEVSEKLVKYCDGHPMALKVLGRSLHNRDVTYWEGYIDTLKKENNSPINNVLRMSFDSLSSENDKDLFKHISCFFVGMDKNDTLTILEACDIETKTGITNLIDKCLLNIGWYNELRMHQLVQEMGRFVVREESLSCPWERSRLWGHESFRVLNQEMGTKNVLGLTLDMKILENKRIRGSLELKTDALSMMDRLMLLQLNYVQTNGSYEKFPKELRWLCMHGFPWKSIPSDLPMENVVALDMSHSNIESFGIFYSYPQRLHKRLKKLIGSCSDDKRLLGSLKILNLSFCEQLRRLGGFDHLPKLEKLILNCCTSLLEVCESIEECVELVHADLSYCNKLGKLPRIIGMLKKVNTLLLEGCALGESRIKVNNIGINSITSSSTIVGAMPSYSKFFAISLPRYLVSLSLENNNLSTESFPVDFSCLTMLKELHLDENPIVSLPFCVRSLPRLQILGMSNCNMLTTIENPPPTLKYLSLYFGSSCNRLLRKVVFDPQMSPLMFIFGSEMFSTSSFEFEGIVKIQPVADVEEKVLHCLGWTNLDFLIGMCVGAYLDDRREESEIQMYYEFGIFSTIYWSKEMPNWITDRSMGSSISFTIPSSPNNLTGLNCCCMVTSPFTEDVHLEVPLMKITNITKNLTWIYQHYVGSVLDVGGKSLMLLSHWMFGMNEMECGDHVTITVIIRENPDVIGNAVAKECGVCVEMEPSLKMSKCTLELSLKGSLTYWRMALKVAVKATLCDSKDVTLCVGITY
ncbi:unnamed protein product [Lactuca saligna]|uniref:TIR domain-containing protein n=1 Tax=Lactuca saligna TaxID=75948 RepID=A0AA35VDG5_LACSI|nr:unnamed protein product [Lactuca saligna]